MANRAFYEERTEQLLIPLMEQHDFELVDVEYVREAGNWYLRAYIDKEGGITIDDCELISRALSDMLDEEDFIEESYILEVSSPGLGRPLKKEKDYKRALDQLVEIRLYRPIDGQKEYTGVLEDYDDDQVIISLEDDSRKTFQKKEIALIRMAIVW